MDGLRVAYISEGKLYLTRPAAGAELSPDAHQQVVSRFGQEMLDRDVRRRQKDEWKQGSAGWSTSSLPTEAFGLGSAIGVDPDNPEARPINIVSVCAGAGGKLVYALETDTVGGLFAYDPATGEETRLVHRSEFRLGDLDRHPEDGRLLCCLAAPDGSANLAVMGPDGGRLQEITEGDSLDQAPAWVEGETDKLVYQSAGIARDQHGQLSEVAPYRVESVDLATGQHEVLFAADNYDCMMPRMTSDGTIYYVRRPYRPLRERNAAGPWPIIKDVFMFPVRLAVAVVAFLNFFSMIFTQKPLYTAGGPKRRGPQERQLFLYGRLIEADKQRKQAARENSRVSVPDEWELVKSLPHGKEQVLATGVGHYTLLPDAAGVLYTDGSSVFELAGDTEKPLAKSRIIERIGFAVSNTSG